MKTAVLGYGNIGRQDDGIGPEIIFKLKKQKLPDVYLDADYQLNIENAYDIAAGEKVIFVDASHSSRAPYEFYEIQPAASIAFSTHTLSPQSLLAASHELFNSSIKGYILAVRGYAWDMAEGLSAPGNNNMQQACNFLLEHIKNRCLN
ncbi:MAG TPA: hydrogenase maturation protease [Spirochaetota bacterium]|nr:hydrogenase maturation protease [Spirochaetota bacterium]